jgi:hypothetical protein
MKVLLNFLGIVLYFLLKYKGRTDKTLNFSHTFWLNDNWPESLSILIFDGVTMLLLLKGGLVIDLNKWIPALPDGVAFTGDLAISFLIGLLLAGAVYELFQTKVKK